jgi:glycosyltransferase involved in cell wall biosynthesis
MAHILFVSYEIAPTTPGGVGVFVAAISEALLRDGHRVTLLLDISESDFDRWTNKDSLTLQGGVGLRGRRLADYCGDINVDSDAFPSEAHWRSYRFAHALARLHAQTPIDFVEFFDYCGSAYYTLVQRSAEPWRFPARVAIRLHNTIEIIDRRVAGNFESFRTYDYALERAALALADLVLSPGQRFWEDECASLYPSVAPHRVQLSFPVRRDYPRVQGAGQGADIVFVGRISAFKGADKVLHAATAVLGDKFFDSLVRRFVVIGPGETVSSVQSEQDILSIAAGAPNQRLLLTGRLPEDKIRGHFGEAALAIFPNRMESFCYAAHEAHMAGTPLILSDTPAFRDHFTEGQSALFFDGTVGDLVEKIRICLTDPSLRARLAASVEQHRQRYRQHDYDRHLAEQPFEPTLQTAGRIGIVVAPIGESAAKTNDTVGELASALPNATIWRLESAGEGFGHSHAFGERWQIRDQAGKIVSASTQRLPPAVAFIPAGVSGAGAFLADAAAMLANESRIGAVLPARFNADGMRRASSEAAMLDRLASPGGAIISAVMRSEGRATLADLFEDGSELTEVAALLRLRSKGAILVDHPVLGVKDQFDNARRFLAPGSAIRARMLRQFAWFNDKVLLADELASREAIASRLSYADGAWPAERVETRPSASDTLVLRVPEGDVLHGYPNRLTILELRHTLDGPVADKEDFDLAGRWETTPLPDRTAALVGKGGRLEMTGAVDPRVNFLVGPDQGIVHLAFRGRSIRICLHEQKYGNFVACVTDLLALCSSAEGFEPTINARILKRGDVMIEVMAGLNRYGQHLAIVEKRADHVLAKAMNSLDDEEQATWFPSNDARSDLNAVAMVISRSDFASNLCSIDIFGGPKLLPLVDGFLRYFPRVSVVYTLIPSVSWRGDGWESLRATAALATRNRDRLCLRSAPGATLEGLRLLGAPVESVSIRIPKSNSNPPSGPVSLIFSGFSPDIPSCGHIATAASELVRKKDAHRVYLPYADHQSFRILSRFGDSQYISRYDDLDDLLTGLKGSRFIYCSPFADGAVDPAVLTAIGFGGLALIAPGSLVFPSSQAQQFLQVVHWEDFHHITDQLRQAINQYDALLKCFRTQEEDALA